METEAHQMYYVERYLFMPLYSILSLGFVLDFLTQKLRRKTTFRSLWNLSNATNVCRAGGFFSSAIFAVSHVDYHSALGIYSYATSFVLADIAFGMLLNCYICFCVLSFIMLREIKFEKVSPVRKRLLWCLPILYFLLLALILAPCFYFRFKYFRVAILSYDLLCSLVCVFVFSWCYSNSRRLLESNERQMTNVRSHLKYQKFRRWTIFLLSSISIFIFGFILVLLKFMVLFLLLIFDR